MRLPLWRLVSNTKGPPHAPHDAKPANRFLVGVFGGRPDKRPSASHRAMRLQMSLPDSPSAAKPPATGIAVYVKPKRHWRLIPSSGAKVLPEYVPRPIVQDYEEACAIQEASPKASA